MALHLLYALLSVCLISNVENQQMILRWGFFNFTSPVMGKLQVIRTIFMT